MNQLNLTLGILVCVLLTTAGQIALKTGASAPALVGALNSGDITAFAARAAISPVILVGLVLYATSAALWLLILARTELSYAYPFISLGYVLTALYGRYALHEPMSIVRIAGITLIVIGVLCISRS